MLTDINILAYNITFIDVSSCTTQDLPHTNVKELKAFFLNNEDPSLAQKMEQIINIANKQNKKPTLHQQSVRLLFKTLMLLHPNRKPIISRI